MKVTISIEVDVPDDAKYIAVDKDGTPWAYYKEPTLDDNKVYAANTYWADGAMVRLSVLNWRETLAEVAATETQPERGRVSE